MELEHITGSLARAWEHVDATGPKNKMYSPGLGPFDERDVVRRLINHLAQSAPEVFGGLAAREVPYARSGSLDYCDLCVGRPGAWQWAIEIKVARVFRNNGDLEPSAVSHILSPYEESALRDCVKILAFERVNRRAILIIGYDYPAYPIEVLIEDFETLAMRRVSLGGRVSAAFSGHIHPFHRQGWMFAWEVTAHQ